MEFTERLTFDDADREDLYNVVERQGRVREEEARRVLNLDPTAFGHHLTVLRRNGYIRKVGDELQIAHTDEEHDVHEIGDDEIVIRSATEDDRDQLEAVVGAVAREGSYIEAETVAAALDYDGAVTRHNDLIARLFFVAELVEEDGADDELVGWVHLELPEAEKLAHTAELTVGLAPGYRGRGIGDLLLERGVRWASEHGYEKPVCVFAPLLSGLTGGKMSASDESSKVNLNDSPEAVAEKIQQAYCPQGEVEDNGVLEYLEYLVFPVLDERGEEFHIERPEEYGGDLTYETYADLEADFLGGELHPADLKPAAGAYISEVIAPVREHLQERPELLAEAYPEKYD